MESTEIWTGDGLFVEVKCLDAIEERRELACESVKGDEGRVENGGNLRPGYVKESKVVGIL